MNKNIINIIIFNLKKKMKYDKIYCTHYTDLYDIFICLFTGVLDETDRLYNFNNRNEKL